MRIPGRPTDGPDPLAYELMQEMASSLGRAGRRLERALLELDAALPQERAGRVHDAAEALWYFVVQREACGLRGTEALLDELSVPPDVRLRMGVRRPPGPP